MAWDTQFNVYYEALIALTLLTIFGMKKKLKIRSISFELRCTWTIQTMFRISFLRVFFIFNRIVFNLDGEFLNNSRFVVHSVYLALRDLVPLQSYPSIADRLILGLATRLNTIQQNFSALLYPWIFSEPPIRCVWLNGEISQQSRLSELRI